MIRIIITLALLAANTAFAQSAGGSGGNMNLIQSLINGQDFFAEAASMLATSASWLIGIFLTIRGIYKLAQHSAMPQQVPLNVPLSSIIIGAMFVYFGMSFETIQTSIFTASTTGGGNILMPGVGNSGFQRFGQQGVNAVLVFMKLVGIVAFMRGLLQLKAAGEGKDGMVGRALTHIAGGAIAFNGLTFAKMVGSTFGWF